MAFGHADITLQRDGYYRDGYYRDGYYAVLKFNARDLHQLIRSTTMIHAIFSLIRL